jgi:hypothetical protein
MNAADGNDVARHAAFACDGGVRGRVPNAEGRDGVWHEQRSGPARCGINDIQVCNCLVLANQVSANVQTKAYAKAGAAHIRRFQAKHAAQLKAKAV